jgi:hypothetical protein
MSPAAATRSVPAVPSMGDGVPTLPAGKHPDVAPDFAALTETMRRCAAILRDSNVRWALGGSVAAWARGGPESCNDLDFVILPQDAARAQAALVAAGMRAEQPPEDWLLKVWDGDVLVDLIFELTGVDVPAALERADTIPVAAIDMPVLRLEDVFTAKLLSFNDHHLDFSGILQIARALREQVDWAALARATDGSPYARAFLTLAAELGIIGAEMAERP